MLRESKSDLDRLPYSPCWRVPYVGIRAFGGRLWHLFLGVQIDDRLGRSDVRVGGEGVLQRDETGAGRAELGGRRTPDATHQGETGHAKGACKHMHVCRIVFRAC